MTATTTLGLGAMLRIPADALLDVSSIQQRLKVRNPTWDTASYYQRRQMQEWLTFYRLDQRRREVLVPRNFPLEGLLRQPLYTYAEERSRGRAAAGLAVAGGVTLRPYQETFYREQICEAWNQAVSDIHLNMPCGHGKTLMALVMAASYKRRTLVVVTTHALAQQFKNAAGWITPGASCGVMEPGKKWEDWDLTIATYSMLSDAEKFPGEWFDQFGHLVLDEWHRSAATSYYSILERAACWYRTFLSATLRRRDGLAEVLKYHVFCTLTMQRQTPGATVLPLLTGTWLDLDELKAVGKRQLPWKKITFGDKVEVHGPDGEFKATVLDANDEQVLVQHDKTRQQHTYRPGEAKLFEVGDLVFGRLDTAIAEQPDRQRLTYAVIEELLRRGRTTLVLSRRTSVLYTLSRGQRALAPEVKQGVVISQKRAEQVAFCKELAVTTAQHERYCTEEAAVTYASNKMAEEGYDNDRLDTMLVLHPLRDVEQAVGRILRIKAGKKPPLLIYLVDNVRPYAGAWKEARKMFQDLGHLVLAPQTWEQFLQRYGS